VSDASEILNNPDHTATHEAGHAVIARVLTLACGSASVVRDNDEGHAGHSITEDPFQCVREWEKRGKVRFIDDAVWHARIIALMAGAEAEVVLLQSTEGATVTTDTRSNQWQRNSKAGARAMTRMLVRRHRLLIERHAAALLEQKTLRREELDSLVGRSVDDVKVNAPFLLMMRPG
jgi:hypothetical protein